MRLRPVSLTYDLCLTGGAAKLSGRPGVLLRVRADLTGASALGASIHCGIEPSERNTRVARSYRRPPEIRAREAPRPSD